jgi:Gpi18-like mannosyltransferase
MQKTIFYLGLPFAFLFSVWVTITNIISNSEFSPFTLKDFTHQVLLSFLLFCLVHQKMFLPLSTNSHYIFISFAEKQLKLVYGTGMKISPKRKLL